MSSQKKKKVNVKVSFDDKNAGKQKMGRVQNHEGKDDGAATQANDSFASNGPLHLQPSRPSHVLNNFEMAERGSLRIAFKQEFIQESLEFHKSRTLRSQIYHENDYDADDSFVDNGQKKTPQEEADERMKKYKDNTAMKLHENLNKADIYMDEVTKTINLSDLYEIADYYYTSENQKICPVLLLIKNEQILMKENKESEDLFERGEPDDRLDKGEPSARRFKYLLQIWRKSDATMLYERKLKEVPMGWGMQNSEDSFDMFFYQEADGEDDCVDNRSRVYCFTFQEGRPENDEQDDIRLHAFSLPMSIKQLQARPRVDTSDQFRIGVLTEETPRPKKKQSKGRNAKVLPRAASAEIELEEIDNASGIIERYNQKRDKKPPKIRRNICCIDGKIVLATNQTLVELDLRKLTDGGEGNWKNLFFTPSTSELKEVKAFEDSHCEQITIQNRYRFINFTDAGTDGTSMILEHEETKQIRFVLLKCRQESKDGSSDRQKLAFEQLGIAQRAPENKDVDIVKTCTAKSWIKSGVGPDEGEKKMFYVTMVLRTNGQVEVYSDYELTEQSKCEKNNLFCVDIVSDTEHFYLRYLKLEQDKRFPEKLLYEIRQVSHQWRSRIKYSYSKVVEVGRDWDSCKLKTLSQFMRLYPQWIIYSNHFLIAHRGYISVQDLNREDQDITVRRSRRKKKPKKRSVFCCTVSDSEESQGDDLLGRSNSSLNNTQYIENQENKWIYHIKVDEEAEINLNHIRDMYLEKRDKQGVVSQANEKLRYHAQPNYPLHKRFVICVVYGLDKILSFNIKKSGKLVKCKLGHVRQAPGCILDFKTDEQCRTGTLLTVTGNQSSTQKSFDSQYFTTYECVRFDDETQTLVMSHLPVSVNHLVYNDLIRRARAETKTEYQIMHLNYKQLNCIFKSWSLQIQPQISEQNMSPINEEPKVEHKRRDANLHMDGQLQIVETNKSLWNEELTKRSNEEAFVDPYITDMLDPKSKKSRMTAVMSYKKGEHLKLIPFFKPPVSKEPKSGKVAGENPLNFPSPLLEHKVTASQFDPSIIVAEDAKPGRGDYTLFDTFTIDLLDKEKVKDILYDQGEYEDIVLLTFVGEQVVKTDIEENSFIIVTNNNIHVFNDKRIETARINGLQIVQARMIDSQYLYIMEEFCDQVFEAHADDENDNQLLEYNENENFVQESGFTAINFFALFSGEFKEVWVCHAATGHNSFINRSWTTDDLSLIRSLEDLVILPIPHWNSLSFVGMGSKNQYLIWKDSIDGFFTALRSNGELVTWSSFTGKLLWEEPQDGHLSAQSLENYRVYRSDKYDTTYLGKYYNYNDTSKADGSYSISLLASKFPVDKYETGKLLRNYPNRDPKREFENDQDRQIAEELIRQQKEDLFDFDAEFKAMQRDNRERMPPMFVFEPTMGPNGIQISRDDENSPSNFKHKLIKSKLYHFKVIQLKQLEDVIRDNEHKEAEEKKKSKKSKKDEPEEQELIKSECKLLFHFFHKLLHPFERDEDDPHYFKNSDWYLTYENIKQRLYLSCNAKKMLEVIQNRLAIIWEQQDEIERTEGELVCWQHYHSLPNFPFYALEVSSLPYFISDDFEVMCEFNSEQKRMYIVKTKPESDKNGKHIIRDLPVESIHLSEESNFEKDIIKEAFSCVAIRGSNEVVTYNTKSGLLTNWPIKWVEDEETNEWKLDLMIDDGETFISKYADYDYTFDGLHVFEDPDNPKRKLSIVDRLFYRTEQFKYSMRQRCARRQVSNFEIKDRSKQFKYPPETLEELQAVYYGQKWTDSKSSFNVERPFTWLDWKRAELIETKQAETFASLQPDEQIRLLFSVFPQGNSLLRMLALTSTSESQEKKQDSSADAEAMFTVAQEGFEYKVNGSWKRICPEVPLITDCFGLQPLDYSFGMVKQIQEDVDYRVRFLPLSQAQQDEMQKTENLKLVQVILKYTKDYRSFQNTLNMVNPIIKAVELKLPEVFEYLNSRIQKTDHIPNALNTAIMEQRLQNTPTFGDYGLYATDDLTQTQTAKEALFKADDDTNLSEKKKLYDFWWFDVPLIFEKTHDGSNFMVALQKAGRKNVEIYSNKGIQLIVENQWRRWKTYNTMIIMLPMCVQLFVYTVNSCFFQPQADNVPEYLMYGFEVISAGLAGYFLFMEIITAKGVSRVELEESWKELALNFLSPILILTCQFISIFVQNRNKDARKWYWELLAWTSFCLWFRFLLMLRCVRRMSPAVSMVLQCLYDSGPYLLVVLIGVLAFSDAFQSINQIAYMKAATEVASGDEDFAEPPFDKDMEVEGFGTFWDKYLGEYVTILKSSFIGSVIGFEGEGIALWTDPQWLLYLAAILFNAIVLMNLLLALVGEIFSEVHGKSAEYTYQQLVNQICLLQRINPNPGKRNSLEMIFMANQRKDDREIDSEGSQSGEDGAASNWQFEKVQQQLTELSQQLSELNAKTDRMTAAKKKQKKAGVSKKGSKGKKGKESDAKKAVKTFANKIGLSLPSPSLKTQQTTTSLADKMREGMRRRIGHPDNQ